MMKRSRMTLIPLLLAIFVIGSMQAMDNLTGEWNYQVEQTDPQYQKGKIVFEQGENDEYSGKIVFESGRVITMSSLSVEADTVTFKAYVDGGMVTTVLTMDGNELSGSVQSPEGVMPITATKE